MCGIFGIIRNADDTHAERATAVLRELGIHSMERGRDSSGIAFISSSNTPKRNDYPERDMPDVTLPYSTSVKQREVAIFKETTPFDQFWNDAKMIPFATDSSIMIGHTRAATQGNTRDLANASPMVVKSLVGTHNGDINKSSVRHANTETIGETDTEHLYLALEFAASLKKSHNMHRGRIINVLNSIQGRAALAWVDMKNPRRIFLARAGLSPLSVAYDRAGNLYWASNPRWFRDIDEHFDGAIGFKEITMVPEGTLLTVDIINGTPQITDIREFTPTIRATDKRRADMFVWKKFTDEDEKIDKDSLIHKVLPDPVATPKKVTTKTTTTGLHPVKHSSQYANFSNRWEEFLESGDKLDMWDDVPDCPNANNSDQDRLDELFDDVTSEEFEIVMDLANDLERAEETHEAPMFAAREAMHDAKQKNDYSGIIRDFVNSNALTMQAQSIGSEIRKGLVAELFVRMFLEQSSDAAPMC